MDRDRQLVALEVLIKYGDGLKSSRCEAAELRFQTFWGWSCTRKASNL